MYADEKTFNRGTGGGPTKSFPGSLIATVGELLQTKMTGKSAVYDSDGNVLWEPSKLMDEENINDADILPEVIEEEIIEIFEPVESVPNTSTTKSNWIQYTPNDLKSRSTLTSNNSASTGNHASKKQKTYQDKITSWASTRANLSEQQQSAFIEQHKLKMEFMREKHTIELKMMAEKHQIEIEILQLQKQNLL